MNQKALSAFRQERAILLLNINPLSPVGAIARS